MSGDRIEAVMGTVSSDECSKNGAKNSSESAINKKKGGRVLMQMGIVFMVLHPQGLARNMERLHWSRGWLWKGAD
ncbi:hypothetical protein RchiOBHm_Chr6g0266511 [Rosa chinensis]|uniref:Uncharacterized protein n=1 Tax=Rosa chinensis TaxID=74649 RepID=A0A2P6PPQ6_ROSCH|nr:hypothetical protein RchiOBHm_Chr6g0266511 [Rosa chinensis]